MRDKKLFLKTTAILLSAVFALSLSSNQVNAQQPTQELIDELCQFGELTYGEVSNTFGPNATRTGATGHVVDKGEMGTYTTMGLTTDQTAKCALWQMSDSGMLAGLTVDAACQAAISDGNEYITQCQSLTDDSLAYGQRPNKASVYGMAYVLENAIQEPLPVSMAYYFDRKVENVPIVGSTVFAQSRTAFQGPLLSVTYYLWELTRDFALAAMAIIMITLGIMIMTRKRVDAQTMVTVQYAVPRVIISLTLIFLSYNIGAGLASFGWSFGRFISQLVENVFIAAEESVLGAHPYSGVQNAVTNVTFAIVQLLQAVGTGGLSIIAMGVLTSMMGWAYLAGQLYAFMVYVHILIKIVTAPIEFAIGTVPGSNRHTQWFKEVLGKILGMTMLYTILKSANNIARIIIFAGMYEREGILPFDSLAEAGSTFGTLAMRPFLVPAMTIYLVVFGIRSVKKVEGFVTGDAGPKKR